MSRSVVLVLVIAVIAFGALWASGALDDGRDGRSPVGGQSTPVASEADAGSGRSASDRVDPDRASPASGGSTSSRVDETAADNARRATLVAHDAPLSVVAHFRGEDRPVHDFTVRISPEAGVTDADFSGVPRTTTSAAVGRHVIWLEAETPAGGIRRSAPRVLELRPGEPVDLDLELVPARDLRGMVTPEHVAAIAHTIPVTVTVQSWCEGLPVGEPRDVVVGSNGEFAVAGLPPAWVSVSVVAPGYRYDASAAAEMILVEMEEMGGAPDWLVELRAPVVDLRAEDGALDLSLQRH